MLATNPADYIQKRPFGKTSADSLKMQLSAACLMHLGNLFRLLFGKLFQKFEDGFDVSIIERRFVIPATRDVSG